ncbi:MAG: class I SAM-dependent methyltransferase [Bacteroidetes bacterium]|nr:class I SAM-dependent methyltransferase [Bacteroidota bacterium]
MFEEKFIMFRNRLQKVYRHISKIAKRQQISCYRIYDYDLPEFPFCIELYDDKIYLAEYKKRFEMADKEHGEWLQECLAIMSEIIQVPKEKIYLRQRQRKEGREGQYEKLSDEQEYLIVHEGGLQFKVNLTDYLDTGLFLDHRITRNMVREEAKDKQVLNLFCYTGSFSVYAAAGGAAGVTSVDLSKTYLNWAEDNFKLNGFEDKEKYHFVHADVKQWLNGLPPDYYDIVIMDPPTFSNSKRMVDFLDIQRDHAELLNKTLHSMRKGGVLYFSNNLRSFQLDAEKIASTSIKDITKKTTPFDFQGKLLRCCYKIVK